MSSRRQHSYTCHGTLADPAIALRHVYLSQRKSIFLILSDSGSSLHAVQNMMYDQFVLLKMHELYGSWISPWIKRGFFLPGSVATLAQVAANYAAEFVIEGDVFRTNSPHDLKLRLNSHVAQLWQHGLCENVPRKSNIRQTDSSVVQLWQHGLCEKIYPERIIYVR